MHNRVSIRDQVSGKATEMGAVMSENPNQENTHVVGEFWQSLEIAETDAVTPRYLTTECLWHGPDPINRSQIWFTP